MQLRLEYEALKRDEKISWQDEIPSSFLGLQFKLQSLSIKTTDSDYSWMFLRKSFLAKFPRELFISDPSIIMSVPPI